MSYSDWITQSGVVFPNNGKLLAVGIVATSAGAATATLYHGRDDAAKTVLKVSAPASDSKGFRPPNGIPLPNGLYIALGSNVDGVLVVWEPL